MEGKGRGVFSTNLSRKVISSVSTLDSSSPFRGLFPLRQFPLCQFPLRQFPFGQLPTSSIPTLSIPIWSMLTKWELTKWELTKWEVDKVGKSTIVQLLIEKCDTARLMALAF